LAAAARKAFDWLAALAPAGYQFELTDAVYLRPVDDLDASVVAVEAVLAAAAARGIPVPAAQARLAACHVRRGSDSSWYAGDAACRSTATRPSAEEAVAMVADVRAELVDTLCAAGAADLADTAPRWAPVPVDDQTGNQSATK
jgi:hypothetical protein